MADTTQTTSDFEVLPGFTSTATIAAKADDHETVKLLQRAIGAIRAGQWQSALGCITDAETIICLEQSTFAR